MVESRPYDAYFDATFTGPRNNPRLDSRVAAALSQPTMVAGAARFKYFRRPIAPRMSAIPPNVLLAPTKAQDPMIPVEEAPEPLVKSVEVQTAFRESEAQTQPYTPDYFVPEGEDPDVLLLKDLTFGNGLPLGKKDLQMIEFAKSKRILESSLPPFTDEASVNLRKRLMENQEMREFKVREAEIDRKREERLAELRAAIMERDASNELLASQRVDATRQIRMEERDTALGKIRQKRIKVLRALARKRNAADKAIYSGQGRDIVTDYFDKASEIYAPIRRDGRGFKPDPSKYDINSRTAPLDSLQSINQLEGAVPRSILAPEEPGRGFSPLKQLSKTEPLGIHNRIRAAEDRMTSAAARAQRNTKRDVEEMYNILQKQKKASTIAAHSAASGGHSRPHSRMPSAPHSSTPASPDAGARSASQGGGALGTHPAPGSPSKPLSSPSARRGKNPNGRPHTPDLLSNADMHHVVASQPLRAAVVLLQRLLRGRAVQNLMYEGRLRRSELIAELRAADDQWAQEVPLSAAELGVETKAKRLEAIERTTLDAVGGIASSHLLNALALEKVRFLLPLPLPISLFCCSPALLSSSHPTFSPLPTPPTTQPPNTSRTRTVAPGDNRAPAGPGRGSHRGASPCRGCRRRQATA